MVNKVTWKKVGSVTEPGRYMFTFGWLTITAEDLKVWHQFPDAAFTLVELPERARDADSPDAVPAEEFHLGAFELPSGHSNPDH